MAYEKKERSDRPKGQQRGGRDRKPFPKDRSGHGDKPRKNFSGRRSDDKGRGQKKGFGDRPRGKSFQKDGRSRGSDRPRFNKSENQERQEEPRKLLLPQDASRLLYRGIDCQVNGNENLAMIMFLHGSVMMSEGCQNNALRILKEKGKANFVQMRTDIAPNCSEEALLEYDYLCITLDGNYDRSFFDRGFESGNTHAIFRKICLEEIEGDDKVIDEFASRYPDEDKKVIKGLELLLKKKDSVAAEKHLERINESIRLKQSIYVMFTRAMNGDARAVQELKHNSKKVPEAAFFSEYLAARSEGNHIEWLRSKYPQYSDLIITRQGEFKIGDTPFGMFLKAKNLEYKKEEFMSVMMNAARAGSPEAMDELSKKMFRNDVRKCMAGIYLKEGDLVNLITVYQAGLDDTYYLDQYCGDDRERIVAVGSELGKQSVGKEIDWLKDHFDKGMEFCKDELISRSKDDFYHNKKMIYALHDIGADREAAELYFSMEGNPEIPSVKWLKKVCSDEDVLDYVREHYEDKGDMATFQSIFEDDGYERRPKKQGFGRKSSGKRRY